MAASGPVLFVTNLHPQASQNEVFSVLSDFGKVKDISFNRMNNRVQFHGRSCTVRVDAAFDIANAVRSLNNQPLLSLGPSKLHVSATTAKDKKALSERRSTGGSVEHHHHHHLKAEMKTKQSLDKSQKFNHERRNPVPPHGSRGGNRSSPPKESGHMDSLTALLEGNTDPRRGSPSHSTMTSSPPRIIPSSSSSSLRQAVKSGISKSHEEEFKPQGRQVAFAHEDQSSSNNKKGINLEENEKYNPRRQQSRAYDIAGNSGSTNNMKVHQNNQMRPVGRDPRDRIIAINNGGQSKSDLMTAQKFGNPGSSYIVLKSNFGNNILSILPDRFSRIKF